MSTPTILANPSTTSGTTVAVRVEEYGGAYDGIGPLIRVAVELDLSLADAYDSAKQLVLAANRKREERVAEQTRELAEIRALRDKAKGRAQREMDQRCVAAEANHRHATSLPGPFLVVPARMLTPEQKSTRADLEFKECASCAAKPGCPTLCAACLHNRQVVATLHAKLEEVALSVREEIFEEGHWRSCSGCHESDDGHPTGPYSKTLRCHLGSGCHECGGIGATWETFDPNATEADFAVEEDT